MEERNIGIKYEYIRIAWIVYTCISIVLAAIGIILDWSGLTVFWIILAECIVTFLVKYIDHVEQSLKAQAYKAKKAERSKTDFLANMSHEIRTPMNAIVGMCELTLRESDISNRVRENCYNIQSSGRSLLSIINDILDFSKIDSGKMELIESEFNIASTLNDVINMAMTRKGNKDIEIIVDADPDIPCGLYGDELRIRQVVINLITNAVKFTKEGSVTLKLSHTKQDYGINLNITVSDSGIGITEENLEKLFTSFQQVDTRKNRSVEGTGLGLAISKRLVTRMGGFINVNSKYGKGSEFKITIPMQVTNPEPFISVKDAEKQHILGYFNPQKFEHPSVREVYGNIVSNMGNSLHVDFKCLTSFDKFYEALEKYGDRITHCIIGKEEYLEYKDFFDRLADSITMILVQDKINAVEPKNNIRCIFKPFYTLPIAACLNDEPIINANEQARMGTRFVAPKAKILIVDDNEINREVAAGLMRPYHMQIMTVDSGRAAIEALKSKEFHLVFMDHMMPEMDGVETTQKIRSMTDPYYKKLPIIALTANAISGVKEMFIRSGFSDFMAKPIELSVLDRMLKNWLPDKLLQKPVAEPVPGSGTMAVNISGASFSPEKGLYYTGGDEDAYKGILAAYIRTGYEKINYINRLCESKDWTNYVIEVHALKSSSLMIGAEQLSESAKKLEIAGKAGDYRTIIEGNSRLMKQYAGVVDECQRYLKAYNATDEDLNRAGQITDEEETGYSFKLEIEEPMLEVYIEDIAKACDLYDGDEIVRLCQEAGIFSFKGRSLKEFFNKVKLLAEDFEFEKALASVESIPEAFAGE
ncbi:MAG: ATP-binding protein [Lachnospiraceae bacterium]